MSLLSQSSAERYDNLLQQHPDIERKVKLGHLASYLGIRQETLSRLRATKEKRIKIKSAGLGDRDRIQAIRQAVGADSLRIDANGIYDPELAVVALKKLAQFNLDSVEQPIPRSAPEVLAKITSSASSGSGCFVGSTDSDTTTSPHLSPSKRSEPIPQESPGAREPSGFSPGRNCDTSDFNRCAMYCAKIYIRRNEFKALFLRSKLL